MIPRIAVSGTFCTLKNYCWEDVPAGKSIVVIYEDTSSHCWFIISFAEKDRSHRSMLLKFAPGTSVTHLWIKDVLIIESVSGDCFNIKLPGTPGNPRSSFISLLAHLKEDPKLDGIKLLLTSQFHSKMKEDGVAGRESGSENLPQLLTYLRDYPSRRYLPRADLCCLIDNAAFCSTLTIRHALSGNRWNVNEKFLLMMYPSLLNTIKLRSTIQHSRLPLDSINAFIRHLFHRPIHHTNSRIASRLMLHSIHLSREIGLPWGDLEAQYLSSFSGFNGDDASWSIIDAWNDEHVTWNKDEAPMDWMMHTVNVKWQQIFIQHAATVPSSKMMMVMSQVLTSPAITRPAAIDTFQGLPAMKLKITSTPPSLKTPSSFFFVFGSQQSFGGSFIEVNPFYLYPQWHYFRRAIDSKLAEANDRELVVGPQFNVNIFTAILESLLSEFKSPLTESEALILLENARELELVNLETGKPHAPFESLISYCTQICFPTPTDSNLPSLLYRYHRLENDDKVKEIIGLILKSKRSFTTQEFLTFFNIDLCQLIFDEMQRRARGTSILK